jgi:hypothetical protein
MLANASVVTKLSKNTTIKQNSCLTGAKQFVLVKLRLNEQKFQTRQQLRIGNERRERMHLSSRALRGKNILYDPRPQGRRLEGFGILIFRKISFLTLLSNLQFL